MLPVCRHGACQNEDRISSSLSEADATQQRAREELESQLRDLKAQVENQRSEKQTTVQVCAGHSIQHQSLVGHKPEYILS